MGSGPSFPKSDHEVENERKAKRSRHLTVLRGQVSPGHLQHPHGPAIQWSGFVRHPGADSDPGWSYPNSDVKPTKKSKMTRLLRGRPCRSARDWWWLVPRLWFQMRDVAHQAKSCPGA